MYISKYKLSICHEYRIKEDKIIYYPEQGTSQAKISKILKVSRGTVQEVIKRKIESGNIKDGKKGGNPTKLTKNDYKYLKMASLRNRIKSSQELGSGLAQTSGT